MIDPFCDRKEGNPSRGLSHCGYDVSLGGEFKVFQSGDGGSNIRNLKLENGNQTLCPSETIVPGRSDTYPHYSRATGYWLLMPDGFVLAHTLEHFRIPNYIMAEVKDKSSLARLGVAVQNTVLEPGWEGQVTLEISNHGSRPVLLQERMGIAQVVFRRIKKPMTVYHGKYQGQMGVQGVI